MANRIITLLTDFGLEDGYVAAMKGVIFGICPDARPVDVSHLIAPRDVRAAAFVLSTVYAFFSKGTVHLAVVDPGVGSARKGLAVRAAGSFFVGPDNGIFSLVVAREPGWEARSIENPAFMLPEVSRTFHGRDVFAPAAALIASGVSFESAGPPVEPVLAAWGSVERRSGQVAGEILHVDRFGNAITNVRPGDVEQAAPLGRWTVRAGRAVLDAISGTYSGVPSGKGVALVGSSGYIEIAVNRGSAAVLFGLRPGEKVVFERRT